MNQNRLDKLNDARQQMGQTRISKIKKLNRKLGKQFKKYRIEMENGNDKGN